MGRPLQPGYTRWILREHGITLTGPMPRSFINAVPADFLGREAASSLPTLLDDLATWIDIDNLAWGQRYAVVAACRLAYTLQTAQVATKLGALEWALRTFHPRWRAAPRPGPRRTKPRLGSHPTATSRRKPRRLARSSLTSSRGPNPSGAPS
jgi:hypothetical protein